MNFIGVCVKAYLLVTLKLLSLEMASILKHWNALSIEQIEKILLDCQTC